MLKDCQLSPVYLAVDALDEGAQGRPDLIHPSHFNFSYRLSKCQMAKFSAVRKLAFSLCSRTVKRRALSTDTTCLAEEEERKHWERPCNCRFGGWQYDEFSQGEPNQAVLTA